MKTINLLPSWYLEQRRYQKNVRLQVGAMVLLGAAMFGITLLARQHLAAMQVQSAKLAEQLSHIGDPGAELQRQQQSMRRLEELKLAHRELGKPIPYSKVIQQVQNAMTPGMALSNVGIDVRSDPVKGSGFVGDSHNPPRYHDTARISIVGIAPRNEQISQLLGKVSTNPLFTDVTLDYTRAGTLEGYSVLKFEIQMSMDLERLTSQDPDATLAPAVTAALPTASGGMTHGE